MFELPEHLPSRIVPFAWLLGDWEGSGVIEYMRQEERIYAEFAQHMRFEVVNENAVFYRSVAWILNEQKDVLAQESGYWSLRNGYNVADPGPALLPGSGEKVYVSAEHVEQLRHPQKGFELDVALTRSDGTQERYEGYIQGPRIDIKTQSVAALSDASGYIAATRMYGLVDRHLLWAWDIEAFGHELVSHASARLAYVSGPKTDTV